MAHLRREPGRPGRHEPPAPSRRMDVRVPVELADRLMAQVAARNMTRHQAIREAIAEWVEKRESEQHQKPESEPRHD